MSLLTYELGYGHHLARLRRRAYAPMSNTTSHDNHDIWVWGAAGLPIGPLELRYKNYQNYQKYKNYKICLNYKIYRDY